MGITKDFLFTESQNTLANIYRAIGHPARIAILQIITTNGGSTNGQLSFNLQLAQSTISQHLGELKSINLIYGVAVGPSIIYDIDYQQLHIIQVLSYNFFVVLI